ncbi:MAG: hypothetical protein ACLQFI_10670 [Methylocella sp.]
MVKTRKSAEPEESVLRDTREVTALEHYRYSGDRPKPRKPPENYSYVEELAHLQFELIKLQEWVQACDHAIVPSNWKSCAIGPPVLRHRRLRQRCATRKPGSVSGRIISARGEFFFRWPGVTVRSRQTAYSERF